MSGAIFLSAGVPDPRRGPEFAKTADPVAIAAAVSALLYVSLGRRLLVWGGHPAITPMIFVVAEDMGVDYGSWVKLYQSEFFNDDFPEDNERFSNVVYTENKGDRDNSLRVMRERMFKENVFDCAVFIGGMGGILDEFSMFQSYQPQACLLPLASTGGGALEILRKNPQLLSDVGGNLDYVGLFHNRLQISVRELRYQKRDHQPVDIYARMWTGSEPLAQAASSDIQDDKVASDEGDEAAEHDDAEARPDESESSD